MSIISIQNLTKDFGPVRAVDDLSFDIDEGKVVGFLGPNGSGKTTTLRSLVGLVTPTAGTATINGVPYAELRDPLSQIGVMLEAASHPARTARNHLRVLAAEGGIPASRADEMLDLVDLGGAARRRSGGFSLGMTQRLGLAAALLGDPGILVLDEPANGLDPEGIRWLRDFLRDLAGEGRTVLLSSHVLSEVAQTVDEVVVINHGRLITHSTLDELDRGAGPRVRVRSPQLEKLAGVLTAWGFDARRDGSDALLVAGAAQEQVGQLAFDHGVVLHEIAAESSNLEDVFFDLTSTPRSGGGGMTALVKAELLKLRTLRSTAYAGAGLLLITLLTAGLAMGDAGEQELQHAGRAARHGPRDRLRGRVLPRRARRQRGGRRVSPPHDLATLPREPCAASRPARQARHLCAGRARRRARRDGDRRPARRGGGELEGLHARPR